MNLRVTVKQNSTKTSIGCNLHQETCIKISLSILPLVSLSPISDLTRAAAVAACLPSDHGAGAAQTTSATSWKLTVRSVKVFLLPLFYTTSFRFFQILHRSREVRPSMLLPSSWHINIMRSAAVSKVRQKWRVLVNK